MYHSKKIEKVKVVVYCSAQFQGMFLNSELLQSTNLTNVQFGWNGVLFLTRPSGCYGRCAIYILPGTCSCGGSGLYAVFLVPPGCDLDKGSERCAE